MQQHAINTLEFDKILDMLKEHALSAGARTRIDALAPILNRDVLGVAIRETGGALDLIERFGTPPLAIMEGLADAVLTAAQGGLLTPAQLSGVATFINTCRRMALYMKKGEQLKIELSLNGRALIDLSDVQDLIEDAIRGDEVSDSASPLLRDIRRRIGSAEEQLKRRLSALLQSHKEWFSDGFVSIRNGRSTLPVKAQHRAMVPGSVIDRSNTGGTLFIEPQAVRQAQDELQSLRLDEENEVRRVLYQLSSLVADAEGALSANARLMERLDFAFAKAKLGLAMGARIVPVVEERRIRIVDGRHPLLDPALAVPLRFEMGGDVRGVVITGPNTGGKTVALKTIGLLSMMAQCALMTPVGKGSSFCMHNQVLVDIGDGQNIAENLSTFSSHMTQVLNVLGTATQSSLVLLDELGSGTDPQEGMGLAVAILDELARRGCLFVVTTHYPEVKQFAAQTPGLINARMTFDPQSYQPLYQLLLNEAGESCALMIAKRLGFADALIERARSYAYAGGANKGTQLHVPIGAPAVPAPSGAPKITAYDKPRQAPPHALSFGLGDSVRVYPEKQVGIVARPTDDRGMILVQLRQKKQLVAHKRLKLICKAEHMYPDDYDFSIIFDSVHTRKARNQMEKRHDPDLIVELHPPTDGPHSTRD